MGTFTKDELDKIKSKEAGWKADADVKEAKKDAQTRAVNAYNQAASDKMSGKKDYKNSDYLNIESYAPNFKKSGADIEGAGKAIEAADQEKKREEGRSPRSATMMESLGFKKGGKVKSASARADGCCIRGKTRA
jgi:hypothetical protein